MGGLPVSFPFPLPEFPLLVTAKKLPRHFHAALVIPNAVREVRNLLFCLSAAPQKSEPPVGVPAARAWGSEGNYLKSKKAKLKGACA